MDSLCGFDRGTLRRRQTPLLGAVRFGRCLAIGRLNSSDFLDCRADPAEPAAEIRQIDQGKQQARDPENMHMREKRNQAQNRDDLELKLVSPMRNSLRQGVQSEKQNSE